MQAANPGQSTSPATVDKRLADQPYINNYRAYDDRVGETTRSTYHPPDHEWY